MKVMTSKKAVVPHARVRVFYKGHHCKDAIAGDIILVQHSGKMPATIRLGQRIRYFMLRNVLRRSQYESVFCQYNHAMVVVEGGERAKVSQMEAAGGRIVDLFDYTDMKYTVVSPIRAEAPQRAATVRMARWCEGIAYGWFSILGCVIDVFIPVISVALGTGQRMICSTATSYALRCMGFIPDKNDTSVMPADIARYFDVRV